MHSLLNTKICAYEEMCKHFRKDPEKGKEAAAPSNIKEIQEIQGGQEAPHNGGTISPKMPKWHHSALKA
jgi:hypothetical protein